MEFLSPGLLFGLGAVLVPPLIHLLSRRNPEPVVFPAIELLLRARRRHARRLKLRQWILILLRSLLLGALALAMSRPLLRGSASGVVGAAIAERAATVVVLDQSYAMRYRLEDGQLFDRARREAQQLLESLKGPTALILADVVPRAPLSTLSDDRATLRQALQEAEPLEGQSALEDAVTFAYQLLEEAPAELPRRVVVISTPARLSRALPAPSGARTTLLRLDPSGGASLSNTAVTGLQLAPAPQLGIGRWQLAVEISHWGTAPRERVPVEVYLGDQVHVRGFIDLPAVGQSEKIFYLRHEGEQALPGELRVAADALPLDDRRSFWLAPQRRLRILALNGDPRPTPRADELFYLERALAPEVTGGPWFSLEMVASEGEALTGEPLSSLDVVLLANLPRVSAPLAAQLERFVRGGGGLWLTMGARVNPDRWNESLRQLLPQPLRGARRAGDAAARLEQRQRAKPRTFKAQHPIFAPFPAPEQSTLRQATVSDYMLVEPSLNGEQEVLIALDEGAPLLIERQVGEGRVLLLTGSLDSEWGDLPLRPDFVPLSHALLRHLAREVLRPPVRGLWGRSIELPLLADERCVVLDPRGGRHPGEAGLLFTETRALGHYQRLDERSQSRGRFVVNLPRDGSQLIATEEHAAEAGGGSVAARSASGAGAELNHELWHGSLFALFLLLLFEGIAAFKIFSAQRGRRAV